MRADKNEGVGVDKRSDPGPDPQSDRQRLPKVVEQLSDLVFRETPTVAISSLVSVLSGVLLVTGADPVEDARHVGEAIQGFVRQHLNALPVVQTSSTDAQPVV
jgi:hypothetical protein